MILICIILLILLLPLLFYELKEEMIKEKKRLIKEKEDRQKNPWRYQPRPKRRRNSNKSLPPLTAWTWWMYADKNSGRFPDAEWYRQYSRRNKRK